MLKGAILPAGPTARLNLSKAREVFPDATKRDVFGEAREGKDLAAPISIEDLRRCERLAQEKLDSSDIEDVRAAVKEAKKRGSIPLRDLMRKPGG